MASLDLSQLKQALDTTTQDLFRWETLPAYEVASDGSDYFHYLDGADAPTPERKQPWPRIAGDFWLIDGREALAMHYQPDGQFRAAEILDPQQVAEHRRAAEVAWELGEDFTTWWNTIHSTTARRTEQPDARARQLEALAIRRGRS